MRDRIYAAAFTALYACFSTALADEVEGQDQDAPCMEAVLTGVGGPAPQKGKAQSGVFVRYGTTKNGCDSVRLQFDAGRGTLMRLSQIPTKKPPRFVTPQSLDALFITHGHSDHTSSLPDIISTRWVLSKNDGQFSPSPPPAGRYSPLPVICFDETCQPVKFATRMWKRHEIPGRQKKDFRTTKPSADIRKFSVHPKEPKLVWSKDDVTVSAVAVEHIEGSVGYKVETPAGSLCISGDTAVSNALIEMCDGVDVMIHDTTHPVFAALVDTPPENADPKFIQIVKHVFESHTSASDLNVFNGRVSVMVMTHLTPGVGAGGFQGVPLIPYLNALRPEREKGPLSAADFCTSLRDGGYEGRAHLGMDLMKIHLAMGNIDITGVGVDDGACLAAVPG